MDIKAELARIEAMEVPTDGRIDAFELKRRDAIIAKQRALLGIWAGMLQEYIDSHTDEPCAVADNARALLAAIKGEGKSPGTNGEKP